MKPRVIKAQRADIDSLKKGYALALYIGPKVVHLTQTEARLVRDELKGLLQ